MIKTLTERFIKNLGAKGLLGSLGIVPVSTISES